MTNSRAKKSGSYEILDTHLATGTEATYTYTPGTALDLKTKYHEITVLVTGKATAALSMQVKVNADTDYDITYILQDTTTLAGAVAATQSTLTLINSALIDGAVPFYIRLHITCNDATDTLMLMADSAAPHEGIEIRSGEAQGSATTVTSIEIKVTTSTWIAGTEITTIGLLR